MRLPTAEPTWHKAYLVPIGVPDTIEMRRELAGRVTSALLDDITLDVRASPESSPSLSVQDQGRPFMTPPQTHAPVACPLPISTGSPFPASSSPVANLSSGAVACASSAGHPSPIARPSRILPRLSPLATPFTPNLDTLINLGLATPPPSALPSLDVQNSIGHLSPPALTVSPASDIRADSGLTSPSPFAQLPYCYSASQDPSYDHLLAPASAAAYTAYSPPFTTNSVTTAMVSPHLPTHDNNDGAYSACSFSPSTMPSPTNSSTSSLAPQTFSPTFLDTLATVVGSIDHDNYDQYPPATASPPMAYPYGFQGAQPPHSPVQYDPRLDFSQPSPFLSPPPVPTETPSQYAMYSPLLMSLSPMMFDAGTEDAERAYSLSQQVRPQSPLPHPHSHPRLPSPVPISMYMERHTDTYQVASPTSPPSPYSSGAPPDGSPGSSTSSSTSSRYTDYMYGYGGNGHWWWDHHLHEQYKYDFAQDEEDHDYHYDHYHDYSYGDGKGDGNGTGEMECLYSFVYREEHDKALHLDSFLDMDSDSDDDLAKIVLDYGTCNSSLRRGTTSNDNIIDGNMEATPPMEKIRSVVDEEEDIGDGWTHLMLDRNYESENDSDDPFSFVGTPSSYGSSGD